MKKIMTKEQYEEYARLIPNREQYNGTSYEDYLEGIENSGISVEDFNKIFVLTLKQELREYFKKIER